MISIVRRIHNEHDQQLKEIAARATLAHAAFRAMVTAYNTAVSDFQALRDDVVRSMDDYAAQQPPEWRDTDAGRLHRAWTNEWEDVELDVMDIDEITPPSDVFDGCPVSPGGAP